MHAKHCITMLAMRKAAIVVETKRKICIQRLQANSKRSLQCLDQDAIKVERSIIDCRVPYTRHSLKIMLDIYIVGTSSCRIQQNSLRIKKSCTARKFVQHRCTQSQLTHLRSQQSCRFASRMCKEKRRYVDVSSPDQAGVLIELSQNVSILSSWKVYKRLRTLTI